MNFFSWVCPRNTVHSNSRSPSQHIYYFSYCSNSISISSAVSDECILSNYYLIYNVEQRLATGWTVRRSNPGGARFSAPVQTGPGAHLASCTIGTGSFPGVKSDRDVTLTPHPLLVPWSWKSRAIPLLPLWAVRPVQSLSACTRVTFTLLIHIIRVPVFVSYCCSPAFRSVSSPDYWLRTCLCLLILRWRGVGAFVSQCMSWYSWCVAELFKATLQIGETRVIVPRAVEDV